MIRVLINGRYLTQAITGVQRCAAETVRALDALVAQGEYPGEEWSFAVLVPPAPDVHPSLTAIPIRVVGWTRGQVWEQLELPLHTHQGVLLNFANTAPVAARHQCVTIHDASVFAVPQAYRAAFRSWYRILIPALGRRADRIVTDSRFSRDELIRWAGIPEHKLLVVPLAGEHILSVPSDSRILRRHGLGSRPFLIAVGSDAAHKNLGAITRAADLIGQHDYDIVVAGGRNPSVFEVQANGSAGRLRRLGYVTDGELRALYENATCLVCPSLYEGFGLPPLEAMACGCPVIASTAASLPEVCGDAALYCDPHDPQDIAHKIERMLREPELRVELRKRALLRSQQFRWADSARSIMTAVERMSRLGSPVELAR